MAKVKNVGRRYGRLTVLRTIPGKPYRYECLCDCGTVKAIKYTALAIGDIKSCGCLLKELQTRSGLSTSLEYSSWRNMHLRIRNPKKKDRDTYKGLTICSRWQIDNPEGFINFCKDMGPRVNRLMTLDRINNDRGYEPDNCRWATKKQQVINRRTTRWISVNERTMCMRDWVRFLGIDVKTFYSYMKYHAISYEDSVKHYLERLPPEVVELETVGNIPTPFR